MTDHIENQFKVHKISQLQLDPFGVCNAKCWFCPVSITGNAKNGKEIMSPVLLEKIIKNLIDERDKDDGLVSKNFGGFYTAHYNEILLYPHFEELLKICQQYKLCFMVLSNGVTLTPEKIDLMNKYDGIVNGICLNIPAFERDVWSKRVGMNPKLFDKLISNINYAINNLPEMVKHKTISIQINGVHEYSFEDKGGWLTKGPNFPTDIDLNALNGELATQERIAKTLFPEMQIFSVPSLIDRAGSMSSVISNKSSIIRNLQSNDESRNVIRCGNGIEVGGRPIGWLHVNSQGKAFLCCNDVDMEFIIGDFNTNELSDFWGTDKHIEIIKNAYSTICKKCASARFS